MNKSQTSWIIALVTLTVGTNVALAEPVLKQNSSSGNTPEQMLAQNSPRKIRRGGGEWGQGKFLEQLNLTEQQRQKISNIRQKYQSQIESLRDKLRTNHQELRTLMSGTASSDQIRAKHQELSKLQDQLQDLRFNSMLEMRDVLTPQQRTKLSQLMEQHRQQRRNGGNEPPPPEENEQ